MISAMTIALILLLLLAGLGGLLHWAHRDGLLIRQQPTWFD
ncbi:hypothetical protein FBY23_2527 [Nocardioides sp. SLBN-35]|nr:hypothetical protein FBY23_2527 [Nocardioides sp. SLBN-35]